MNAIENASPTADVEGAAPRHAIWRNLSSRPEVIVAGILAVLIVGLTILRPGLFATEDNLRILLLSAALLLVVAVGQTFVVITGGIDLSIGGIIVLSSVLSVQVMSSLESSGAFGLLLGLVVALVAGSAFGAINGLLVGWLRLSSIIVTLGMFSVTLGLSYVLTDGEDLRDVPDDLNQLLIFSHALGLPVMVWIAIGVCLVGTLVLEFTVFGRYTYAVGSDVEAAERSGIAVRNQILWVYALSGGMSGLAAYMSVGRFTTTSLAGYSTISLDVVTAVALGGASLFGGRGTIIGSVIGVFIPVVLQNGLIILNVQSYWQQVVTGLVLVGAITLDKFRRANQRRG